MLEPGMGLFVPSVDFCSYFVEEPLSHVRELLCQKEECEHAQYHVSKCPCLVATIPSC